MTMCLSFYSLHLPLPNNYFSAYPQNSLFPVYFLLYALHATNKSGPYIF